MQEPMKVTMLVKMYVSVGHTAHSHRKKQIQKTDFRVFKGSFKSFALSFISLITWLFALSFGHHCLWNTTRQVKRRDLPSEKLLPN